MTAIETSSLIIDDELRLAKSDPSIPQRSASNPERHVWVRASAGSGKTKVLVDRLLRLLLPDPKNNAPGVAPDKILCLTFTKAGAAEMNLRLQKKLLQWSALPDDKLDKELVNLIGGDIPSGYGAHARRLLAKLLDAPQRLRILTIHSFCQSVLGRFPIETGLSPDFKVIEDTEAAAYLTKALHDALSQAAEEPESDLGLAFERLAISKNLEQLQADIKRILSEPVKLQEYLEDAGSLIELRDKIATGFQIADFDAITETGFCKDENFNLARIKQLADMLDASDSKPDRKKAAIINDWLSASEDERISNLSSYMKEGLKNSAKEPLKTDPQYLELLHGERERYDLCKLAKNIASTADLLYLAGQIFTAYSRHKKFMGVLDYGDLIFMTSRLLSGKIAMRNGADPISAAWVLYKLDEGIDHILVDESQDTNPDQWEIVKQLSLEYFSGEAKRTDRFRSLFVVGDEKQSIFSFQRADVEEFYRMRDYFAQKVAPFQDNFEESLFFSFRSTAPVLRVTDAVFESPDLQAHIGVTSGRLRHISFRSEKKEPRERLGSVELWPLVPQAEKPSAVTGWDLPVKGDILRPSAQQLLARRIAARIGGMIDKGEARAGDVMILMRSRSALMLHIIRELKLRRIPVSGLDRLVLSESLIVEDLLAACDFALLPDDSFALACLLKSPFIGLSEDVLMRLSMGRPKELSLWAIVQADEALAPVAAWLKTLLDFAGTVQPYEFLDRLLTLPCPADQAGSGYRACQARLGADVIEPLDEILAVALRLELQEVRTLQDFVASQRGTRREIKREMEETADEVRIMTVHASKGLEAPIVILPDTMSYPNKSKLEPFMWPDKSGLPAPLWCDGKSNRSDLYEDALDHLYELQIAEHSRLLYVALTRAKERLIICGAGDTPNPKSWYSLIDAGFTRLAAEPSYSEMEDGTKIFALVPDWPKLSSPVSTLEISLPIWARTKPDDEPDTVISFSPSTQEDIASDEKIYSPLDRSGEDRFRRGLATHKLLQILPDLPVERREAAARSYVARKGLGLSSALQESIVAETMNVLTDPVFAPVFGPDSLAEVPVTGDLDDGRRINGQIDRLIVRENEILIVDFKTNRPSPHEADGIPPSYRAQLKAYADALRLIYPEKAVKCALLWTDRPLLMQVNI